MRETLNRQTMQDQLLVMTWWRSDKPTAGLPVIEAFVSERFLPELH